MDKKQKKRVIMEWLMAMCIFAISIVFFMYISKQYANNLMFQKKSSFLVVTILTFTPFVLYYCKLQGIVHVVNIKSKILNIIYFIMIPAIALFVEEFLWNDSWRQIPIKALLVNYILIAILAMCICLIICKIWVSYTVVLVLYWLYGLVNHYVLLFKGRPPLYTDLLAAGTATTVMGNYNYELTGRIIICTLLLLIILVCMHIVKPADIKIKTQKKSFRVIFHISRIAVPVGIVIMLLSIDAGSVSGLSINAWDPTESVQSNGAPISMLISYDYAKPQVPDGYSKAEVQEILSDYVVEDTKDTDKEKPLVLVVMNESFSDLSVLGSMKTDDYLEYWNSLDSYVMRGNVYTSVVGGGTCNSEFEFLTGDATVNTGSGGYLYQNYNLKSTFNIAAYLKDVQGYNTVAFHPYKANNWNRTTVYRNFNFDQFISIDDMTKDELTYVSWGASDACDYQKVEQIIEDNEDAPLFLFNVTMQNHGGYTSKLKDGYDLVSVEDRYAGYEDVVNYLTLIQESDHAYEELIAYLEKLDRPVVLCMFGDHQPALDDSFINDITSSYTGDSDVERMEQRYITPYMIWSNYDTGVNQVEKDMSLNYLGANLLDVIGYRSTYTNYLLNLEKEIPIMNVVGYQTNDEVWHSWNESNTFVDDYKKVQYYEMFGRKRDEY